MSLQAILEIIILSFMITLMVTMFAATFATMYLGRRGTSWLRAAILANATVVLFLMGYRWDGLLGALFLVLISQGAFWASIALVSRSLFPLRTLHKWLGAIRALTSFIFDFNLASYVVDGGKVEMRIPGQLSPRLGSGVVLVGVVNAAVMQTAIHFTRVIGPGVEFMRRFERIKTAVDLHNQMRLAKIQASTKDAVPLETLVFCLFRIDPGENPEKASRDFAHDPKNIRQVVYGREGRAAEDEKYAWDDYALQVVISRFREIIARFRLDQLFEPNAPQQVPRLAITSLLNTAVRNDLSQRGIEMLWAGYGTLQFADQVVQQRVESWQAEWTAQAESRRAIGAAEADRQIQTAWSAAQWELVQGLINGLSAAQGLEGIAPADLITWQLLTAIETMSTDPLMLPLVPQETLDTMLSIREWLDTPEQA